ncbi:MAG TPA: cyclic nucleotide-binding domain-containing protein [Thermoanaerobaculia bacterium]|nr:cyclic nucleotide-binding domain-containing protein [Thermoanaerobaculia bacterium]
MSFELETFMDGMDYSQHPFFQGLDPKDIEGLLSALCDVTIAAGETFIHEGKQEGLMYVVFAGTTEVYSTRNGGESLLAVIEAPAVLGEIEALSGGSRAANVRAKTEVQACVLDAKKFFERIDAGEPGAHKLLLRLARVLAKRLSAMNQKFTEIERRPKPPRHDELREFQRKLFSEWSV